MAVAKLEGRAIVATLGEAATCFQAVPWPAAQPDAISLAYVATALRSSLASYERPRFTSLTNARMAPNRAIGGVVAGSTFAVHELWATMLLDLQRFHERRLRVQLDVHVD